MRRGDLLLVNKNNQKYFICVVEPQYRDTDYIVGTPTFGLVNWILLYHIDEIVANYTHLFENRL